MIYSYIDFILDTNNYEARKSLDIELIRHYYNYTKYIDSSHVNIDNKNVKVKFTITSEFSTHEIIGLTEKETEDISTLLFTIKDMKLVTIDKNIILVDTIGIYKHSRYDIWFTHVDNNVNNVLNKIEEYAKANIFTIRKVKDMYYFKEFYQSYGYTTFYENEEYVSIKWNHPYFYREWLLCTDQYKYMLYNKIHNNIPLCFIYYNTNETISKLYTGFLFSYIKSVQNTLLASYEFYLSVDVSRYFDRYLVKFRASNCEMFDKIHRNFIEPSKFQEKTFLNRNEALLFRERLSKQNIKSIIYAVSTVVWLSEAKEIPDAPSTLYEDLYSKVKRISPRDDISFEDFEGIDLSELFEVVYLDNHVCRHTSLKGLLKDPFNRKNMMAIKRAKFGNLYRGFETVNGLLGVVNEIKVLNELKINEGTITVISNQVYTDTHFIYDFMLLYSDGTMGLNILSLIIKEIDLQKTIDILQKTWNRGLFLRIWDGSWTLKNGNLSVLADLPDYESNDVAETEDFILQLGYI